MDLDKLELTTRLWKDAAPGARGNGTEDIPAITYYRGESSRRSGACVIVVPGGGYGVRADHENDPVAEWLAGLGIDAFTLRYRVAPYRYPYISMDGVRAVRSVRSRAESYGIDPARIGILGFSAGGHLAATVSTIWDRVPVESHDDVDLVDGRPDLSVLCYPVVSFVDSPHVGSAQNLLGPDADAQQKRALSAELNVSPKTPPTFLFHTADDGAVPVDNSVNYARACWRNRVPCELHVYETGPHGVGLVTNRPGLEGSRLAGWTSLCEEFLGSHGWMSAVRT